MVGGALGDRVGCEWAPLHKGFLGIVEAEGVVER